MPQGHDNLGREQRHEPNDLRKDHPHEHADSRILVIIGQLLEATKTASESIKALSYDVSQNSRLMISTSSTLEIIERTVTELNRVVRTGDGKHTDSLVHKTQDNIDRIDDLERAVCKLQSDIDGYRKSRERILGAGDTAKWIVIGGAWLVTTIIAAYGAMK